MGDIDISLQPEKEEQERTTMQKKALIEAMQKSLGVVTQACKIVGLSRETYYNYYNADLEFKRACDDCSEIALDFAESKLYKQIEENVPTSTIFYLKTKGRKRGYIERHENDTTIRNPEGESFKYEDVKRLTPQAIDEALHNELSHE